MDVAYFLAVTWRPCFSSSATDWGNIAAVKDVEIYVDMTLLLLIYCYTHWCALYFSTARLRDVSFTLTLRRYVTRALLQHSAATWHVFYLNTARLRDTCFTWTLRSYVTRVLLEHCASTWHVFYLNTARPINIPYNSLSVFFFSSISSLVRSVTKLSKCLEYFSINFIIISTGFSWQKWASL